MNGAGRFLGWPAFLFFAAEEEGGAEGEECEGGGFGDGGEFGVVVEDGPDHVVGGIDAVCAELGVVGVVGPGAEELRAGVGAEISGDGVDPEAVEGGAEEEGLLLCEGEACGVVGHFEDEEIGLSGRGAVVDHSGEVEDVGNDVG